MTPCDDDDDDVPYEGCELGPVLDEHLRAGGFGRVGLVLLGDEEGDGEGGLTRRTSTWFYTTRHRSRHLHLLLCGHTHTHTRS